MLRFRKQNNHFREQTNTHKVPLHLLQRSRCLQHPSLGTRLCRRGRWSSHGQCGLHRHICSSGRLSPCSHGQSGQGGCICNTCLLWQDKNIYIEGIVKLPKKKGLGTIYNKKVTKGFQHLKKGTWDHFHQKNGFGDQFSIKIRTNYKKGTTFMNFTTYWEANRKNK